MAVTLEVNIHEAKTQLSKLVAQVERGDEITISRAGKPVARLVPIQRPVRRFGTAKGRIVIHDDFDELPGDILDAFNGDAE